jgi:2-iminobutanoate/2-iminopropanoate deaminase
MRRAIPDERPNVGHFTNAVVGGGFVFVSGQPPLDLATGRLAEGGFAAQARQSLRNVELALARAGCTLDDVVKTTVWLHDWSDYAALNDVYRAVFPRDPPARSVVQGARAHGQLLAIEAIAVARSPA